MNGGAGEVAEQLDDSGVVLQRAGLNQAGVVDHGPDQLSRRPRRHQRASAVGDEAAAAAHSLTGSGARVVSCEDRQAAVDFAASWADVLVLDGPLQLRPRRADWSLLAVDRDAPWGSAACPPRGDLRAPVADLLAHADTVVAIRTDGRPPGDFEATWAVLGATDTRTEEARSLDRLRAAPVHLVTSTARPGRVARCLEAHGVRVAHHTALDDHSRKGAPDPLHVKGLLRLVTDKTRQAARWPNAAWIRAELRLSDALRSELGERIERPARSSGVP